jgi:hypothetical protein
MDLVNQFFALVRDTWNGVVWPIIELILRIAQGGLDSVLVALVIVGIIIFAYQEARR